jgi:hypothetical protein
MRRKISSFLILLAVCLQIKADTFFFSVVVKPQLEKEEVRTLPLVPTPELSSVEFEWDKFFIQVGEFQFPKSVSSVECTTCTLDEIVKNLGDYTEWKVVKDDNVLYFHSGAESLGQVFLDLYRMGKLSVGDDVLFESNLESRFIVNDAFILSREEALESPEFFFENRFPGEIILVTCSEELVPWIETTGKLIIRLVPDDLDID